MKYSVNKKIYWLFATITLLVGIFVGFFAIPHDVHSHESMGNPDSERAHFVSHKEVIIGNLLSEGKYACCLKKPCSYCIEKTPGHGEGATCNCLSDVVNGVHPCGECIGEILEGHGNPMLSEYFARAIAEKVGVQHLGTLKQIISEKYNISVEEQLSPVS